MTNPEYEPLDTRLLIERNPQINYQIRRSQRAQKTRIIVTCDKIEVVAPIKVPLQRIKAFVESQRDWIGQAQATAQNQQRSLVSLVPSAYIQNARIPYQGRHLILNISPGTAKYWRVKLLPNDQLQVFLPQNTREYSSDLIKSVLQNWMKQQARQLAAQLIAKHSPKYRLVSRSLRIKTQKTRWGSCGPNNDINLNWLLLLAPPAIMEYVVVHELCHIKHKNHSQEFWQLVAAHLPNYAEQRSWLKQYGASLMRGL